MCPGPSTWLSFNATSLRLKYPINEVDAQEETFKVGVYMLAHAQQPVSSGVRYEVQSGPLGGSYPTVF
jgi:hypothetical protein